MFRMLELLNFTRLYRAGRPRATGAVVAAEVVEAVDDDFIRVASTEFIKVKIDEGKSTISFRLGRDDFIYGLGQAMGGVNKRGGLYRLYNTDEPNHTPDKQSLYGSHPFMIVEGAVSFGLFIDYPGAITIDAGFTLRDRVTISFDSADFDLYIFASADKRAIVRELLQLIGRPYLPPAWAFGFHQCRWSYPDRKRVEEVAASFREKEIPCDAIYLDIDYMEDFKVFTVDGESFPEIEDMTAALAAKGFKTVPIIDPGVKIEEGFDLYEEGLERGFFCLDEAGEPFVTAVWPGLVHLPDFYNPLVRSWWGGLYKRLLRWGAAGFWNDMNEPALFYTPPALAEVKEELASSPENIDIYSFFRLKESMGGLQNREDYFKAFYQVGAGGERVCHNEIHNLYGFQMARAAAKGLQEARPGARHFLLSRSSYPGIHRYGGIWTGDNASWWEHILLNIKMLINLNMCGFFFTGADIGGFGGNASAELVIRWSQLAVFSPLFRNHSALGTRDQEPFAFDEESEATLRETIRLRYALLPYLYSSFFQAVAELFPFITPLSFSFAGRRAGEVEDQFMVGPSIMAAPVYTPNRGGRHLHLPGCLWLYWAADRWDSRNCRVLHPGEHYIECSIEETPLFIKENSLIVMSEPQNFVGERETTTLTIMGLVTERASIVYHHDDGLTMDYLEGGYSQITLEVERGEDGYRTYYKVVESEQAPLTIKRLYFELYDENGEVYNELVTIDR